MDTKKISGFYRNQITRRKCVSGLLGIGYLSASALKGTFSFEGRRVNQSIIIDKDYVLVDGWLLRTDDLFL